MLSKPTCKDLIGFVGDDARRGEGMPVVGLSDLDYALLMFEKFSGFRLSQIFGLPLGTMVLFDSNGIQLRRHNPGDDMPWRDK